jgi:hypothetical protein
MFEPSRNCHCAVPAVIGFFLFNILALGAHLANIDDADVIQLRHRLPGHYRDPFVAAVYVRKPSYWQWLQYRCLSYTSGEFSSLFSF